MKSDDAWKLLEIANGKRREYGDRIWETVKYFTAVLSAILSAALLVLLEALKADRLNDIYVFVITFFALGVFVSITAWFNVRREYERQMEVIAEIRKAQQYLDLLFEVPPEKRWFKDDKHILLERFLEDKDEIKTDKNWVKSRIKIWQNKNAALFWFTLIFWGFAFVYSLCIAFLVNLVAPTSSFIVSVYWIPVIVFLFLCGGCYFEQKKHTTPKSERCGAERT